MGIIGDLQELFDKFPTPGDNFMLQIPYVLYRDSENNENSWTNAPTLETKYADKLLQIPTHCPTWGGRGLTMIGALVSRSQTDFLARLQYKPTRAKILNANLYSHVIRLVSIANQWVLSPPTNWCQ